MNCNICGRQTMNEEANFCEYCGSSYREQRQNSNNTPQLGQGMPFPNNESMPNRIQNQPIEMQGMPYKGEPERPVPLINWLGIYGLILIPFPGWIILLVLMFIWAFSSNTPKSQKNWARASLIFAGVLCIIIVGYLIAIVSSPMFQQMLNGTFDYNSYYKNLYNQTY